MKFPCLNQNFPLILFKITLLWLPIFGLTQAYAQEKTFELKHQIVKATLPTGWEVVDSLMGQDLTFFGPWKNDSRPIVSVTAIDTFDGSFSLGQMRRNEQDYRKGRMDFLKRSDGELVRFIPYKRVAWPYLEEVHQIGYQYKHQGLEFIEMNYYYKCDRQLHMTSSLLTVGEEALHGQELKALLESLKCLPKTKS